MFQITLRREVSETTLVKTKRNKEHISELNVRKVAGKLHLVKRKSTVEPVENIPEKPQVMKCFKKILTPVLSKAAVAHTRYYYSKWYSRGILLLLFNML